jgi:hypothetical protein
MVALGTFTTPDSGAGGDIFVVTAGGGMAATGGAPSGGAGTRGSGAAGGTGAGGRMAGTGGAPSGAAGNRGAGAAAGTGSGGAMVAGGGGGAGGDARGAAGNRGATGGTAGAGTGTSPTILSIDFVGGLPAAGGAAGIVAAPTLRSTDVAGVKPAFHWNSAFGAAGVLISLTLSDGTSSSAKVTWSSPPTAVTAPGVWRLQFPDTTPDAIMMDGYLDPSSSDQPATILVANLPASLASGGYDVYVYCLGAITLATETRTYEYTMGATSISVSQTRAKTTTFGGFQLVAQSNGTGNYVVFHNITGTAFTLVATPGTGDFERAPVNGIQVVSPP